MENPHALLVLARARLPDALLRHALAHHPSPTHALVALAHGAGFDLPADRLAALRQPDARTLARDRAWLLEPGHRLLAWGDGDYPPLLAQSPSPPPILFVAGDASLLWRPQVAVVGSRRPTAAGRERARRFADVFTRAGWLVTSGLADGIDAEAHGGALAAGGATVAVVGTGLDRPYPAKNAGLQRRIAAGAGVVLGEHPPGTDALPTHFPSRNRIVAALSLGTVVIEAALRSGALITARLAAECGREAFAVPGSPDNPLARGCHRLIRDGAALVEAPDEVLEALAPRLADIAPGLRDRLAALPGDPPPRSARGQPNGEPDHNLLWSALGHDPTPLDVLATRTGLTVAELSSMLLLMELDGRVVADNGRYARRS